MHNPHFNIAGIVRTWDTAMIKKIKVIQADSIKLIMTEQELLPQCCSVGRWPSMRTYI